MKTLKNYLAESQKTFDYRIKVVGDLPPNFIKELKIRLKKFDPSEIGAEKTTPVMSQPMDFPNFPNQSVTMMDASFRYPATPPQIKQMAELLGLNQDRICIVQRNYDDGLDQELLGIQQQKDLLTDTALPEPNAEQKDLSKDYSLVGKEKQVVRNSAEDATWTVAGGKTPPAKTTNDLPMGVKSPMSNMKRPPKPVTGFRT
jgi:hypothetical protein